MSNEHSWIFSFQFRVLNRLAFCGFFFYYIPRMWWSCKMANDLFARHFEFSCPIRLENLHWYVAIGSTMAMSSRSNLLPIDSDRTHLQIEEKLLPTPIEVWPIYIIPHRYYVQHQCRMPITQFFNKEKLSLSIHTSCRLDFAKYVYFLLLSVILNDKFQDNTKKKSNEWSWTLSTTSMISEKLNSSATTEIEQRLWEKKKEKKLYSVYRKILILYSRKANL